MKKSALIALHAFCIFVSAVALAPPQTFSRNDLVRKLQTCYTPESVLTNVGQQLNSKIDRDGSLASLVLVRLAKMCVHLDNVKEQPSSVPLPTLATTTTLLSVVTCFCQTNHFSNPENLVEGTKATATLSRILQGDVGAELVEKLAQFWEVVASSSDVVDALESHHLSGLAWSFDTFDFVSSGGKGSIVLPQRIQDLCDATDLPFRVLPGFLHQHVPHLDVDRLTSEVQFQVDDIRTSTDKVVKERRQTAWEGDDCVEPFAYAGKHMPRHDWSPTVERIRDLLCDDLGQYYDGCLLNHYPDGKSGMRYHIDPDQGTLWDFDTSVVSVGATRKMSFRCIQEERGEKPHSFYVMHGDVTHMFGSCQEVYQHCIKKAEDKRETVPRASLVFKRSWGYAKER